MGNHFSSFLEKKQCQYFIKGEDVSWALSSAGNFAHISSIADISLVLKDVTKQSLSQKKLETSEIKLRTMIELAYQGIITINRNGGIEFANNRARDILKYNKTELENKNYH